jgi:tetratricopeptide (TPR) repeat protein
MVGVTAGGNNDNRVQQSLMLADGAVDQLVAPIAAYRSALDLKPDFHGASFGWALALQKKGDFEGAIERYELTLELKETYSSYVNMAICYKALGDEETSDEYYALADELKKKGR